MRRFLPIIWMMVLPMVASSQQVRIKDIAGVQGARNNQLIGYGLVVGLEGTGDTSSTIFAAQSLVNALVKLGVNVPQGIVKVKNVAAVLVTATLPPFVKNGSQIDITVSATGDAKSLQGGMLIQTPLLGADGKVYAVGQGPISIGGFNASAGGSSVQKNHVNVGRIPQGAIVENEVPTSITDGQSIQITLKEADFTTATRIAEAINAKFPESKAEAIDPYSVRVGVSDAQKSNLINFIAQVQALTVIPDTVAKIVINERTGTIVIGGEVRVTACAVVHGNVKVKVESNPEIAVPAPFSNDGTPVVVDKKTVSVKEDKAKVAAIPTTTTIEQLVKALNALGLTPQDLISILQQMKSGGYIQAEIVVQ